MKQKQLALQPQKAEALKKGIDDSKLLSVFNAVYFRKYMHSSVAYIWALQIMVSLIARYV